MKLLANPKSSMWLCRLVPAITWVLWLVALFSYERFHIGATIANILLITSLLIYLPLIYFILPAFLFGGTALKFSGRVGYFIFTAVTAGIGPVIWYFVSIDRVLSRMAHRQK